jgi:hypothetical protein
MTTFIINGLRFNCGENNCSKAPKYCKDCVLSRLKKMGFEIIEEINVTSIDEKLLQIQQDRIWQIFLDVLNIKHIIIMDKESGVSLLNYPVSAVDVDAGLLSGFIQANISFSESTKSLQADSSSIIDNPFYEFQYQTFNILLKNGNYIRLCMILDHKASDTMKKHVSTFLIDFENAFEKIFKEFQETGEFDSDNMVNFIINTFNISLVFPMTLAHAIPPENLEIINNNPIKKAIMNLSKDFLSSKQFFYINSLLNELKNIVNFDANFLLNEIYQLYENKTIIPMPLETVVNNIQTQQETIERQTKEIEPISSIILSDADMDALDEQIKILDDETAIKFIKDLIKKGKDAEKISTYEIAQKEYKKALIVAEGFDFKEETNKLLGMIFEAGKKAKQVELDFAMQAAGNAEKNNDNINAIYYYQKAVKILTYFLIYNGSDSKIKKIKKRIQDLRENL